MGHSRNGVSFSIQITGKENMLTLLFLVLLFLVFGKLLLFAIKAAWGLSKIICTVILLPIVLIFLVLAGLIGIALPVLLIIGLVVLILSRN